MTIFKARGTCGTRGTFDTFFYFLPNNSIVTRNAKTKSNVKTENILKNARTKSKMTQKAISIAIRMLCKMNANKQKKVRKTTAKKAGIVYWSGGI